MTEWISFYRSFSRFSPFATYVSLNRILGFLFFFLIASFCISLRVPGFSISLGFFQLQSLFLFYFILFYLYFNRFFYTHTHTHTHTHRLSNGVMLVKQYNVSLFKVKCGWILDRHFSYLLAAPHIYQIYINVAIIYIYILIDMHQTFSIKKKKKGKKEKKIANWKFS